MSVVQQVIPTDDDGARLSPEQLAEAGVKPGEPALVEVRPSTLEDWIAEGEGKVLSSEEFAEHVRRCPSNYA